jgi:hypothetical protein
MTTSAPGDEPAREHRKENELPAQPVSRASRGGRLRSCLRLAAQVGTVATVLIRLYAAIREGWPEL